MHIALLQQLAPDGLACATLEKHVIWHNHGGTTMNFEQGFDVLDEIHLLVTGAGPEVVAHDHAGLVLFAPFLVHKGNAALASKGRIGEHHIEKLARMAAQAIDHADRRGSRIVAADAVQEQVHHAEASGIVHDLPAVHGVEFEKAFLVAVKVGVLRDIVMGRQQKTTCATGGIADALSRFGTHHIDHSLDQWTGRKILARAAFGVFGVLLQQPFVGVTLHIGFQDGPGFAVDEVNDQAAQLGRVLDFVLRLTKDNAQHAWLLAQFL